MEWANACMGLVQSLIKSKPFWTTVALSVGSAFGLRRMIQGYWIDRMATLVKTDFSGKHVVITGGNSGIGLGSAIEFAKLNANITITVRSHAKGKQAVAEIKKVKLFVQYDNHINIY